MKRTQLVIFVITVLAVLSISLVIVEQVDSGEIQSQVEKAEAYCYQVYGNAEVFNAMVVGGHGGLHCWANADVNNGEGQPHLHQVPQQYLDRAFAVNRTGGIIDFQHASVAQPCGPVWCMDSKPLVSLVLLSLFMAVGIGVAVTVL